MPLADDAARALELARDAGLRIAVAESVTGGALAAALTAVPGASDVFAGGVVAYSADAKRALLGVPDAAITAGLVSREVAEAMAIGARAAFGVDIAVATTGAAGPTAHDGAPVGRVWIGVASGSDVAASMLDVSGARDDVISGAVAAALSDLCDVLDTGPARGTTLG